MKIKRSILKKISFVLVLLSLGFTFEYLMYRNHGPSLLVPKERGETRILTVGGSIVKIIPPTIESLIKRRSQKKFTFSTVSYPTVTAKIAKSIVAESIEKDKPDIVFLLLGLNETEDVSDGPALLRPEIRERFNGIAETKNGPEFNRYLIQVLKEILQSPGHLELMRHLKILMRKPLIDLVDRQNTEPQIIRILDEEIKRNPQDHKKILSIMNLSELIFLRPSTHGKEAMQTFYQSLMRFVIKGGDVVKKNGCAALNPAEYKYFLAADFRWLCFLAELSGKEDLVVFLERSPGFLYTFFTRIIVSKPQATNTMGSRERRLHDTIQRFSFFRGEPIKNYAFVKNKFVTKLSEIKEMLDRKNIKMILLHYPNLELNLVSDASRELNIKAVDGWTAFKGTLTEDNYRKYFFDKARDTGHLTILGAELYAESLINQLPEVFKD